MDNLFAAIQSRDVDRARELIARGNMSDARDEQGDTPLDAACRRSTEIAILLIESGANVNAEDNKGYTPLHVAASRHNEPILSALLNHGSNVNHPTRFGENALYIAVSIRSGYRGEVIRTLLQYGADPDQVNDRGLSARDLCRKTPQLAVDWELFA